MVKVQKVMAIVLCTVVLLVICVFLTGCPNRYRKVKYKDDCIFVTIKSEYKDKFINEEFTIEECGWDNIKEIEYYNSWYEHMNCGFLTVILKKPGGKQVEDAIKHFETLEFVEFAEKIAEPSYGLE